jgi:hypothetical protein
MDQMTTKQRTLVNVQEDLSYALQNKTSNMLQIGRLLNEAKGFVEHGGWLPWLRRHTALPARTAQQYMAAVAWADAVAAKCATVAHLDLDYLSPKAIYALASGKYGDKIVERVLAAAAAEQRHISEADVKEIAKTGAKAAILQGIEADQKAEEEAEAARLLALAKAEGFETVGAWEAAWEAEQAECEAALKARRAEAERAEAEAKAIFDGILDGGPDPGLPPAPEPVARSSEAFHVATFEKAIEMLRSVMTKPLSTFASAKTSPDDIEQIAAFLQTVAKQIAGKRRAA